MRVSLILCLAFVPFGMVPSKAATIAPPMLDIPQQCSHAGRRSATAMSECIVAESEARAELLQKWTGYSDAGAEKCIKESRKARKLPYSAMAKCLAAEPVVAAKPSAPMETAKSEGSFGSAFRSFFKSDH